MAHNLFIFVPAFGQIISTTTFLTTHALQQQLSARAIGGGISSMSFPDIAELRAMATTIWYDTLPNSSHLLFIDADMGFPPEMVLDMILFDEPLVGAIYAQRKMPLSWAGSGTGETTTERRGNFMLVEGVGMGCTLIRRDCITRMIEAYPEMIDTRLKLHPAFETMKNAGAHRLLRLYEKLDLPERGMVSEDLSFCLRWNKIGGKVWAAIGYRISHVGPYDFAGRYLDSVEAQQAAQQAAGTTTEQAVTPLPQLPQTASVEAPATVEPPTAPAQMATPGEYGPPTTPTSTNGQAAPAAALQAAE